ncbi:2OG-Fe(II) oxygenase [Streptomyces sp. NPDC097619]|uniref:2OG-Fe(II) oxygenase n=1 Tax=Streptomyces sp. NPDC097619 TaxID=3157228 RepID=UPI003321FAC8
MSGHTTHRAVPTEISSRVLPPADRWTPDLVVPAPVCRLEGFLGPDRADALLRYAISREADFGAGTVPRAGHAARTGRRSLVLPVASPVLSAHLAACLPLVQEALGHTGMPVRTSTVLTAHGEGGHYGLHTDAARVPNVSGALSAVYYLHRRPRGFGGGRLRLYDTVFRDGTARPGGSYRTIEPEHDTLVFFPSAAFHEVEPSTCPSGEFADHRFSLTTWISGTAPAEPRPGEGFRIWPWLARAAEPARPDPGPRPHGHNGRGHDHDDEHEGAAPVPLPAARPATLLSLPGPREGGTRQG